MPTSIGPNDVSSTSRYLVPVITVGIYVYPQVEVLDFAGPFEVFTTANRVNPALTGKTHPSLQIPLSAQDVDTSHRISSSPLPRFNVHLIGQHPHTIHARGGLAITPSYDIHNHPKLDILLISGGHHDPEMNNVEVIEWIKHISSDCQLIASVCTGAFLLAQANVIQSQQVTTHWDDIAELAERFPMLKVNSDVRWVSDSTHSGQTVMTSAGISAGIDMALEIVTKFTNLALAQRTAKQMDYHWLR
ncbi:DJ-1/PfpI family protein [Marinibactrum halimedae]|uniref:Glutamine amidotransferase n=1 Tax=Marinibactrum halimedae TaxID=1444977 RepID=A0AA37TAQ8_9GAMM|nr:DJ-1/PfpI family protein [Marinibactrum halimedae]MCD9459341.1 DJ-1/PfpI family protein [Marinibactrum halimedae]GLS25767.1 glutamine amidotransferase [Marinibactrum halimedae]